MAQSTRLDVRPDHKSIIPRRESLRSDTLRGVILHTVACEILASIVFKTFIEHDSVLQQHFDTRTMNKVVPFRLIITVFTNEIKISRCSLFIY